LKRLLQRATVQHLLRSLQIFALGAALLLAGSFAGAACSGDEGEEAAQTEATTAPDGTSEQATTEATTEETTTEEGPPPITAAEQRWTREMNQLRREMTGGFHRTRVYTNAVMAKLAKTYSRCLRSLRRAGEPGRFEPAARIAERACKRAERAGSLLEEALAIEAGISSQAEADRYNAAVERALEAQGNAVNDFAQASARARTIEQELAG
jgi:hypothetical protein